MALARRGKAHGFDSQRLWTGEQSIMGKTVLAHSEQGLGDTLQFVRYVDLMVHAGARVVLRVQDAVLPLLHAYPGAAQVLGENDPVPDFDLHCPLLSLRGVQDGCHRYSRCDPLSSCGSAEIRSMARNHRRRDRSTAIGNGWRACGLRRSMATDQCGSQNLRRYSRPTHSSCRCRRRTSLRPALLRKLDSLLDVSERLRTFADTAALVSQLDLVISVDTSVAHLAGALGTPVWIALLFTPDWRWQMNRTDSPWYPQARLFRQAVRGQWAEVR